MSAEPETLIADRYRLIECLGAGGMGEVWKAQDTNFTRLVVVAVKLLREDETFRDDERTRKNFVRYVTREAQAGQLTLELVVNAIDESFNVGVKRDLLRKEAEQRFAHSAITVDQAASLFDEFVNDSTFNENARHRRRLRDLFATEANAVAILQHPNIVRVTDYGEQSGVPFLVMDYISGRTLQQVIQRREPMPLARRLRLMEDLCEGLGYAHSKDLIHRDIKPGNLIIDSDTNRLKVLDFGVVRTMQFSAQRSISMGAPVGTYCYMSPEQTRASRTLDNRSDIFSCGLVFYELLSYQRAFPSGGDVSELIGRIQRDSPTSLRELMPDLDPQIEAIVSKAIEKVPARRYADLSEMQREIAQIRRRLEEEERQAASGDAGTVIERPKPVAQQVTDLLDRAAAAFDAGHDTTVIEFADRILVLASNQPDAVELKHRALDRMRTKHAEASIEEARALLVRGEITSAGLVLNRPEIDTNLPIVQKFTVDLSNARRTRRLALLLSEARRFLENGRLQEAIERSEAVLEADPANADARRIEEEARKALVQIQDPLDPLGVQGTTPGVAELAVPETLAGAPAAAPPAAEPPRTAAGPVGPEAAPVSAARAPALPPSFSGTAIGGVLTQWPVNLSPRTELPGPVGSPARTPPPTIGVLPAGSKVGKFLVLDLVARGRTGHLYKAFDPVRSKPIGLKVIDEPGGEAVSRLLRASRIWLDLRHPHLQTILEVDPGEQSGTAIVATELIEGVDLERVRRSRKLDLTQKIGIAIQVCDALDYLHTRGIVHREVTPKNIVLSRDLAVTLLDSGLARSTDPTDLQLTALGAAVGDSRYMAPEQRSGRSDQRSDIYSLGAVLYELLFDEEFAPSKTAAARQRIAKCETLPRKLVAALLVALDEDAGCRFESVREFCDGLQSLMPLKLAPLNVSQAVVTLHGIRTHAAWQRAFAEVASRAGWHCCLDRWNFGYFSAVRFMVPWSRVAKIGWFRQTYHDEFGDQATSPLTVERPSIVAHSYGTYILGKALLRYPYLRFNKVLICGSILPCSFPWQALLERGQVQAVRNEYGARDFWTGVARTVVPGTGPSGLRGFDCSHDRFEQEMFDFSHSEYFERGHMEQKWLPFLKRRLPYVNPREPQPARPS